MLWTEIRIQYPNRWVVVEALDASTNLDGMRILNKLTVLKLCDNGTEAFNVYRKNHSINPNNEYFYLHTSREKIEIMEERWLGIRIPCAPLP